MFEEFLGGRIRLHCGDCRVVLAALEENSLDACCCDPPYHLASIVKRFGAADAAPAQFGSDGRYARASAGFMGKAWDGGDIAFDPATWRAVYRVLKPGAHACVFAIPKHVGLVQVAMQAAGFEFREMVAWLFGSGFPKSHDVSKGIDRAGGVNPRDQAMLLRERRETAGMSREDLAKAVGCTPSSVRDWEEGRARAAGAAIEWLVPSDEYRSKLANLLGYTQDEREVIGVAIDRREDGTIIGLGHSGELRRGGITNAAREWEGWGSALKPAMELCVLARKPLSEGTIAANVLRWGTGALNITGCRVHADDATGGEYTVTRLKPGATLNKTGGNWRPENNGVEYHGEMKPGRWPANLVHDGSDEVVGAFPATDSRPGKTKMRGASVNVYGEYGPVDGPKHDDSGSAARFFFQAKQDDPCHSIKSASDVEQLFDLQSDHVVSVLSNAVAQSTPQLALHNQSYRAQSMTVSERQLRIVCESVIEAIRRLERRRLLGLEQESITARLGPVICVATRKQTGITTIILSLWRSARSVEVAMFDIIETSAEAGVSGFAKRFHYTSKADGDDRLASKHPTVKPVDLMQWLVRLVTPPVVWFCFQCEESNDSASKAGATENVCTVLERIQTERQSTSRTILQPSMRGGIEGAETETVRMVRDDLSAEKGRDEEILQQAMFEQGSGAKSQIDKGLRDDEARLQVASHAEPSAIDAGGLHFRTPLGDGATDQSDSDEERGGASHQWDQGRQSSGKSETDDQGRARRFESSKAEHINLSALRGRDRDEPTCPHCGAKLLLRRGRVLDPFSGSGTTGEAAWREGMSAVLIEAEAEYCADIRRRMALVLAGPDERSRQSIKAKNPPRDDGPLFAWTGENPPRDDGPLFAWTGEEATE